MPLFSLLTALLTLAGLLAAPVSARAETYHTCKGFIDSVPATITTQGTWCLRKDLATGMTSGAAITVATNNVTIDCNDFKLGGLAAGDGSGATGIYSEGRQNVTVRHCNVRGFFTGIALGGGSGHLVEDNRLDNNLYGGIYVLDGSNNNLVQRNRVYDTGGSFSNASWGIYARADVIDNTVAGVFASGDNTYPVGIGIAGAGNEARGNRVRGLVVVGGGNAVGIYALGPQVTVAGNRVSASAVTSGWGILGATQTLCIHNTVLNFGDYGTCTAGLDNL